jgi:hypothetical protein
MLDALLTDVETGQCVTVQLGTSGMQTKWFRQVPLLTSLLLVISLTEREPSELPVTSSFLPLVRVSVSFPKSFASVQTVLVFFKSPTQPDGESAN